MKKPFILSFLLLFSLFSCYKDELIVDDSLVISVEHEEESVSGHIIGQITDEFGNTIKGNKAFTGGESFVANNYGLYHFDLSASSKNATQLLIKDGQKSWDYSVKVLEDEINYFKHSIFTQKEKEQIYSDEALDFSFENNTRVHIEADAYLLEGEDYSGQVNLFFIQADLKDPLHLNALPGDRRSLDREGNQGWLDFKQVISVELQGEEHALNLQNEEAYIAFEGEECADCQIWKYDSSLNSWIIHKDLEEFTTNTFDFTSSGFYAIAKSYPYNFVYGQISIGSHALINYPVDIYKEEALVQRIYTTNSGRWYTHLPVNQTFSYKLSLPGMLVQENFTTSSKELMLQKKEISPENIPLIIAKGKSRDCEDELLDNHFLFVEQDEELELYFGTASEFEYQFINKADDEINLSSNNQWLEEMGPKQSFPAAVKEIDLHKSFACSSFREGYFKLVMDGGERIFTIMESRLQGNRTKLIVYDEINLVSEFQISFSGIEPRNYNDNELNILFDQVELEGQTFEINCQNSTEGCGFKTFEIEYYGKEKGDWIKGHFNGSFWVKTLEPLEVSFREISGEFMVPRTFS